MGLSVDNDIVLVTPAASSRHSLDIPHIAAWHQPVVAVGGRAAALQLGLILNLYRKWFR